MDLILRFNDYGGGGCLGSGGGCVIRVYAGASGNVMPYVHVQVDVDVGDVDHGRVGVGAAVIHADVHGHDVRLDEAGGLKTLKRLPILMDLIKCHPGKI